MEVFTHPAVVVIAAFVALMLVLNMVEFGRLD